MTQKVRYNVLSHPTKETPGTTLVENHVWEKGTDPKDATVTNIGRLNTVRGSKTFDAVAFVGGTEVALGNFATRAKAGHAVQRAFLGKDETVKVEALSRADAADRLGVSKSTVARRIAKGELQVDSDGKVLLAV